jgi:hypothetical protein
MNDANTYLSMITPEVTIDVFVLLLCSALPRRARMMTAGRCVLMGVCTGVKMEL